MNCLVNGQAIDCIVHRDDTAIDVLRGALALTGTKLACGAGTCGACTILADDVPVCACLLPAAALDGRRITTIESLPAGDHPVQRAFMYEDALQCGYCTPGFVMQAVAFFDAWRAAEGRTAPPDETIADAFSGHLCRCGAYPNIRRAITRACAGDYDVEPAGAPPRHDAREKVTGAARYTVDVRLPEQVEGRLLRAPVANARIDRLDLSDAAAAEGVVAAIDLTGGTTQVRYAGQEVAAIAAVDRHAADAALARIRLDITPSPPAVGLASAAQADAPRVYASVFEPKVSESELPLVPALWHGNVHGPTFLMSEHALRAEAALLEAERTRGPGLVKGTWVASSQSHTPLEPHVAVARWPSPDELEVYVSTQACSDLAVDIADRWNLPRENVRVRCDFVGGAFGAKSELTMETVAAVELSRASGRPVRVALGNDEELAAGGYRPAVEIDLSLVMRASGVIDALSMTARTDGGVAIGSTVAAVARFPYPAVPKWLADYDVVSHAPPAKPFRGPGGPAAFWALEGSIDLAARQLDLDPIAIRRANDSDASTAALLDWVATIPAWRDRATRRAEDRVVRGVGLAMGAWTAFVHTGTSVTVSAGRDGIIVSCACQDMGPGSRTVLASAVAAVFGVPPDRVTVRIGDSRLARSTMSSGSRTTASVAPAADAAARQVRGRIGAMAAQARSITAPLMDEKGLRDKDVLIPWAELIAGADPVEITSPRPADPGGHVLPIALDGFSLGRARPVSAHVSEVEVDRKTGRVSVPRIWTGLAVGRVHVEALARSQAIGGAVQGVSYALYEERRLDAATGRTLTQSLDDHRLCGLGDAPDVEVHFVPGTFDAIAGGGAGLGELTTIAVAASIGNAVFDATGWRPTELPLRIERVQQALKVLHGDAR